MRRMTLFSLLFTLAAASASAATLAKTYLPAAGAAQMGVVSAAFDALGPGNLGKLGPIGLGDPRAFVPMALTLTPKEETRLTELLAAPHPDLAQVRQVLGAVNLRAQDFAGKAAVFGFLADQKKGAIGDDMISDAKTFAAEYLAVFGPYLTAMDKAYVFSAAVALEQRRLKVEEQKEVRLEQLMWDMTQGLTEGAVDPSPVVQAPKVSAAVLERFSGYLWRALARKDAVDFRRWLGLSYDSFAAANEHALRRMYESFSHDEVEVQALKDDAAAYHAAVKAMMDAAGMPDAAAATAYKIASPTDLLSYVKDRNDAGRDRLLVLIESAARKSRKRSWDAEAHLPKASFDALETLSQAGDPRLLPHLKKVGSFYHRTFWSLDNATPRQRAKVERQLLSGFDGKYPSVPRVWSIWAAAMAQQDQRALQAKIAGWEAVAKVGFYATAFGLAVLGLGLLIWTPFPYGSPFGVGFAVSVAISVLGGALALLGFSRQSALEYSVKELKDVWSRRWQIVRGRLPWTQRP